MPALWPPARAKDYLMRIAVFGILGGAARARVGACFFWRYDGVGHDFEVCLID